jgi:Zn-dependent M28 family amino/carboxypeptidase
MSVEPGALVAASWVSAEFERLGLVPIGDDGGWFQAFEIPLPKLGAGNALEAEVAGKKQAFAVETDWNPFAATASAQATGPLVFAGYGVVNPEKSYDDFAGLDVAGKVVIVLRKEPPWTRGPSERATFIAKLNQAAGKGAAALLVVNDEKSAAGKRPDVPFPWSANLGVVPGSGKIPFAFVTRRTGAALLAPLGKSLTELQASIDAAEGGPRPASAPVPGVVVRVETAIERSRGKNARNVVAMLEGRDPVLKEEFVVLGAHHDHVGRAQAGGSAGGAADVGKIHPGADDNASGTAALLELAEAFATAKERPRRSLLFLSFSGEELGLLGSKHYVDHPIRPLGRVSVMVNCDMVGRYREDPGLEIGGVGSGEGLQALVEKANAPHALKIKWDPQGVAPSDNTSFFLKKVPVLFFFTGVHEQYHTPRDTWDTLSYDGATKVTSLCRDVVLDLANRDARVAYTTPPKREGRRAALGIVPAAGSDAGGVVVQGVADDGPAAKAGIREDDVITAIGETVVSSLADLGRALASKRPGDEVLVKVLRDGVAKALPVTLGSR